jgi:hypothetical protein
LRFPGISEETFKNKDDNDIPLFKQDFGGRPRKTSVEDLLLKEVANNNLWGRLSDIKNDQRFKDLESEVSDQTLYPRINKNGIYYA